MPSVNNTTSGGRTSDERTLQRAQRFPVGFYLLFLGGMALVFAYLLATSGSPIGAEHVFVFVVTGGALVALSAGLTVLALNGLQAIRGETRDRSSVLLALATVACLLSAWYLAYIGSLAAFPVGFLGYVVGPLALAAHVFRVRERLAR